MLAPITEPGPLVETTTISAAQAREEKRDRRGLPDRDDALRGLALTNLLDLKTDFAYWNPDVAELARPESPPPEPGGVTDVGLTEGTAG
jgi:putative transposase